MINHFLQFTLALCFALSTFATAQESAPSTSKKVVAAKITAVVPAGESENSKTATPSASQPLTIDQNAVTIYQKSVAVARALKAIQLTTRMTVTGRDSGMLPAEFMEPTSSIWDLEAIEGSPCKRMRIESIKNEKPVRVITFDGTHSLLANVPSKTYMEEGTNWSLLLKSAGSGVPQWVFEMHAEEAAPSKIIAANIIGEETIDGQPCDMVRILRSIDLGTSDDGDEKPSTMTMTDILSIARADSFPRRLSQKMAVNGEDQMANLAVSYQYSNVKLDPALDASMFATTPPAGYVKGESPKDAPDGEREQPQLKAKVGEKALDFTLTGIDGAQFSLQGLKGKVLLLDFWATWCGPCKQVMPTIQKIADEYKGKDVVVFGVNTWERGEGAAKKYMESKGFTYSCLLAGDELAKSYEVPGIPTLLVIGKDGVIVLAEVGMAPDGGKALRAAIDAALAK
jgi:thiol-disulfide isomerase/thioredoxin